MFIFFLVATHTNKMRFQIKTKRKNNNFTHFKDIIKKKLL